MFANSKLNQFQILVNRSKNGNGQQPPPVQVAPQFYIPVDKVGLRQFPMEPVRRHPRQYQQPQSQLQMNQYQVSHYPENLFQDRFHP